MTPQQIMFTCQSRGINLSLTPEAKLVVEGNLDSQLRALIQDNLMEVKLFLLHKTSIPRLPWELERLLQAATANQLHLSVKGITDLNTYVLAWGCAYLIGERTEATKRLHAIQQERNKTNI